MAENVFRNITIGLIAVCIFVILLFSIVTDVALKNDVDTSELNNYYPIDRMNSTVTGLTNTIQSSIITLSEGDKNSPSYNPLSFQNIGAMFGITFALVKFIPTAISLIFFNTLNLVFNNPLITAGIIGAIMAIVLFGVYRLLKWGS